MTIYEVLKFIGEPLERLTNAGIKTGEKVGYIVAVLAERYGVSERTVYDVVKRFGQDCKPFSV